MSRPQPFSQDQPEQNAYQDIADGQSRALIYPRQAEKASAEYYLKLGNRHYNSFLSRAAHKDLEIAINCYRRALENNPSLAEGYVKLASAMVDKGEMSLETAIQYCQTASSINPQSAEVSLFMGYFLGQAGQTDAALQEYQKAIAKAPFQSSKPRMAYGRLLLQKASTTRKTARANQAKQMTSPGERMCLMIQGLWHVTCGLVLLPADNATFETLCSALVTDAKIYSIRGLAKSFSLVGLSRVSLKVIEWGSRQLPGEPVFFHHLGDLYLVQNNPDAAIYNYIRAQELDSDNALIQKKLARAYALCNDGKNAAKSLEKAVALDATDFNAMYELAQLYTDRQEYMRALYYFKELVNRYEKNPYVHSNMAYVLFKLEDYTGAIKEYRNAINCGDDPVWTSTVAQTLGTIYYQLKQDIPSAIELFRYAHKLDPENLDCVNTLADLYVEQGHYEAAIGAYQYILKREPDNADCYSYIGYLLWQLDKNDEAISSYLKALAFNPDCAIAYNNLGVIYLDEQNDPLKALDMFQMALDIKPEYTLACFNVGRAQENLGETTEAAKTYSNALALNAGNPELSDEEILDRLDSLFRV